MTPYGTDQGALNYHDERGNTAWAAATDEARLAARVRATQWLDSIMQGRVSGLKTGGQAQQNIWPRYGALDSDGYTLPSDIVPVAVEWASYEAALRELATPGSLSPDTPASGGITRRKVKAGTVESETEFQLPGSGGATFPIIDRLLAGVLTSGGYGNIGFGVAVRT